MRIAKFLAGAALVGAPFSVISAQSAPQSDSGATHHNGKWIAGASSAAVGAALFLSFTGNGSGDPSSAFTPTGPQAPPSNSGVPTAGATPPPPASPPLSSPPASPPMSPPAPGNETQAASPPTDSGSVAPPETGSVGAPAPGGEQSSGGASEPPPQSDDSTFVPPDTEQPQLDATPGLDGTSTVPEPGSLALTATGIIGLVPLVRRRRWR